MSTTVQQLINSGQKLVTILRDETVQKALELMIEHDYSQLPVIDRDGKIVEEKGKAYMITSDSILRALSHFGTGINDSQFRVADVMIKTSIFRQDSDLFDLLDDLQDTYAVLIVDGEHKPLGIVTSYDAADYFRQYTKDNILVYECVYHLCSLSVPLFLGEKLSVGVRFQEKGEQVVTAWLVLEKRTLSSVSPSIGDLEPGPLWILLCYDCSAHTM